MIYHDIDIKSVLLLLWVELGQGGYLLYDNLVFKRWPNI